MATLRISAGNIANQAYDADSRRISLDFGVGDEPPVELLELFESGQRGYEDYQYRWFGSRRLLLMYQEWFVTPGGREGSAGEHIRDIQVRIVGWLYILGSWRRGRRLPMRRHPIDLTVLGHRTRRAFEGDLMVPAQQKLSAAFVTVLALLSLGLTACGRPEQSQSEA